MYLGGGYEKILALFVSSDLSTEGQSGTIQATWAAHVIAE